MPYDPDNPPEKLRGLPENKQRQWVHVFNSCYEKYGDDAKCSKMAWGVTGGWKKEKGFDPLDADRDLDVEREARLRFMLHETTRVVMKGYLREKIEKEIGEKVEFVEDADSSSYDDDKAVPIVRYKRGEMSSKEVLDYYSRMSPEELKNLPHWEKMEVDFVFPDLLPALLGVRTHEREE